MTGTLDNSRLNLVNDTLRRDQRADTVSHLRRPADSGPWRHEKRRPEPVRRWPAYLGIMVLALIIALIVGTLATAGIADAVHFQITPNTAHLCGAC